MWSLPTIEQEVMPQNSIHLKPLFVKLIPIQIIAIDLIALPKDSYVHEDAKKQAEIMMKLHYQVRANIKKVNEASKKRVNKERKM